jgi:hypothetical protein
VRSFPAAQALLVSDVEAEDSASQRILSFGIMEIECAGQGCVSEPCPARESKIITLVAWRTCEGLG